MGQELEELRKKLETEGIQTKICKPSNISETLLIVLNYSPSDDCQKACFALSLESFRNNTFPSKCWINNKNLNLINGCAPKPHEDYKEFCDEEGRKFYPFSANLSEYHCDPSSIKNLIQTLHAHIPFS